MIESSTITTKIVGIVFYTTYVIRIVFDHKCESLGRTPILDSV